jgi:hypothetical protein
MKKFALALCLFGMTLSGAGWCEPSPVISRLYAQQCSNLKNTATALEMWAVDNQGTYPDSLQQLTPNYLKHVMPGPGGKVDEVVYSKDPSQEGYSLMVKGAAFKDLGVGEGFPRYNSQTGLELNAEGAKVALNLPLLKPALDSSWNNHSGLTSHQWTQDRASVRSRIYTEPFGDLDSLKRQFAYNEPHFSTDPASGSKWRLLRGQRFRHSPEGKTTLEVLELLCLEDGYMKVLTYETENEMIDQDVYVAFKNLMKQ